VNKVDLLSLILTLRPMSAPAAGASHQQTGTVSSAGGTEAEINWMGRASHALLLDAVRWSNPVLAEELHSGDSLRPFSASNLIGYSRKRGLNPGQTYSLRFTALTEQVASALLKAAGKEESGSETDGAAATPAVAPLRVGATVRLDTTAFRVEAVTCDAGAHPWAAAATYEALSAPWLLGRAQPERRLTLEFNSPTTFKSRGRHVPVPMPELVFGSLLERWNAFAPVAFPAELRQYAEECLALGSYRLRTHAVMVKDAGLRIGAVGQARYVALNYDRYWLSLIHLLAEFAFFAGVGAATTIGLGQCRRINDL